MSSCAETNLAIIPARSGSKGLPNKNILELAGKPLIAHTIEAALDSGVFDEVMVSTDSAEYAEIARRYGASVPFLRSAESSLDSSSSWDVVAEVLDGYELRGRVFDTVCLLQPTSPLRTALDIVQAYDLHRQAPQTDVVSVCEAEHSPLWCAQVSEDHYLSDFVGGGSLKQRQGISKYYRLNGAIYIVEVEQFRQHGVQSWEGRRAYVMEQKRSIDVDTDIDFMLAELLMAKAGTD